MPSGNVQPAKSIVPFSLLAGFLLLVFLTGGGARNDIFALQILRPVAIVVAAFAVFTARFEQWRHYRQIALLLVAAIALTAAHLIPLAPETWRHLPGRGIVQNIDAFVGLRDQWRPFSMVPAGTLNALYALSVPTAVFALAIQLGPDDHIRLLLLLIVLAIVSGAIGLLQAIGLDIRLYALTSENAGLFTNRNHQGLMLAMLFPMLAVAASLGERIGLRGKTGILLAAPLALIAIPLIIVTGSRGGLVAAVLAVLLVPIIGLREPGKRNGWHTAGKAGLAAVLVGALVWLTIFASRETALARLETSEEDIRYPVWTSIVDTLHVYMPWGSGIGSYAEVYQILEPDRLLRQTFSNHAHNEWLEIAMTAGVPGLILVAWAVVLFFIAAWRAMRAPGVPGVLSRLGLGLILLLAFASTLDYPVRTPIMSSVLAIAAVWASSFGRFGIEDGRR